MKAYRFPEYDTPVDVGCRVAVIGGGNVAMDSARSAIRLGAAEVTVVYRRTEKEMPARRDEVAHAGEEGVSFRLLEAPVGFSGDEKGHVREMTLIKNTLGEPDKSGRRRPVPVEGSEEKMRVDTVIMAIGSGANPLFLRTADDLELTGRGYIRTGDDCSTNLSGVFAGGDIVTGSATVIAAIGAGKRAARSMDRYMRDRER
jgi:glutamate synthase (NADPH/NADH) small chain